MDGTPLGWPFQPWEPLTRSFQVCLQIMSEYWAEFRSNKLNMLNLPESRLNITSE